MSLLIFSLVLIVGVVETVLYILHGKNPMIATMLVIATTVFMVFTSVSEPMGWLGVVLLIFTIGWFVLSVILLKKHIPRMAKIR